MRIISFVVVCFVLVYTTENTDWVCFKGNPERSGASDTCAPDTVYLKWEVDTGLQLVSSPVVKSGNVYQVAIDEILCIDIDTGGVVWKSLIPAYHSTPAISDDKLIVAAEQSILALSIKDGSVMWKYEVPEKYIAIELPESLRDSFKNYIVSSPVASDGKVVVGLRPFSYPEAAGGNTEPRYEKLVACLEETSGNEEWYVETSKGVISSPCVAHGKVFVTSSELLCIDLETGKILWDSEDLYPWDLSTPIEKQ